jgi:hypothetical protein
MTNHSNNGIYTLSAIALNNMGVSLAKKGCYQEASETFHDSLQVFSVSQRGLAQRNPFLWHIEEPPLSPTGVQHKVYRASLRLKSDHPPPLMDLQHDESESFSSLQDGVLITELEQREPTFAIHNQYGEDTSLNKSNSSLGAGGSQEYFVFFQQQSRTDQGLRNIASLLQATILHNKGQSLRCLAHVSRFSMPKKSEQLLDKAESFFFLSQQAAQGQRISA